MFKFLSNNELRIINVRITDKEKEIRLKISTRLSHRETHQFLIKNFLYRTIDEGFSNIKEKISSFDKFDIIDNKILTR